MKNLLRVEALGILWTRIENRVKKIREPKTSKCEPKEMMGQYREGSSSWKGQDWAKNMSQFLQVKIKYDKICIEFL